MRVGRRPGGYLRRRAMSATMSWAIPTSRAAVAMCDGSFGPSHRVQKSEKSKSLSGIKATLLKQRHEG